MPKFIPTIERFGENFTIEEYDIELLRLGARIYEKLNQGELQGLHHYYVFYMNEVDNFCIRNNRKLSEVVAVVIGSQDDEFYRFLAYYLSFQSPPKIKSSLQYQLSKHHSKEVFLTQVESGTYEIMEGYQFKDMEERLRLIMEWIEENRLPFYPPNKGITLKWSGKENTIVKLSKNVFDLGFSNGPEDFSSVFFQAQRIKWKGSTEFLVLLLHEFYNKKPRLIKASKGKGYHNLISTFLHSSH